MGGSLSLDSRSGDGTDIHIDLPLQPQASATVRKTSVNSSETAPKSGKGGAV